MDAPHTDQDRDGDRAGRRRAGGDREDLDLVQVERVVEVDAAADDVWRCLSRLDHLAAWLDLDLLDLDPDEAATVALRAGVAAGAVAADGSVRHLLVSEVEEGHRLAWHWWRDDGELSAVEVTLEPADGGSTRVRVVETLALAAAGAGGRAAIQPLAALEDRWGSILPTLGARLVRKLGVA